MLLTGFTIMVFDKPVFEPSDWEKSLPSPNALRQHKTIFAV